MDKEMVEVLKEINQSLKVIANNSERPVNIEQKEKLKELIKTDETLSLSDVIKQVINCL